jgi:hypothetical protein
MARARLRRIVKQAKLAAQRVAFPKDFPGTVMWCQQCVRELARIPEGEVLSASEQQAVVDAHKADCSPVRWI